jgi:hypothetical protein
MDENTKEKGGMMGSRVKRYGGGVWIMFLAAAVAWDPLCANDVNGLNHPLPGDIIITELMVNPSMVSDANGEYVEIYNRTSGAIDMSGWLMRDGGSDSHLIDNGGPLMIESGGYLVLARNANSAENGGFAADYEYSGVLLSNTLDGLILVEPGGTVIDSVVYSEDLGFPLESGASMELRNEFWENSLGVCWADAEDAFGLGDLGSPGTQNSTHEEFTWVAVDAWVEGTPVAPGDSVVIGVRLFNPSWLDWNVEAASYLLLADGSPAPWNPLEGPYHLRMKAGRVLEGRTAYYVPQGAPAGTYAIIYGVREEEGNVLDWERVEFVVVDLFRQ